MKTRRRYNQNIHPTERDRAIIAHLGKYGISSDAQLHRLFWPTGKLQTCQDRLHLLVKGGFLHTDRTTARRESEQIFWIERKASLLFPESVRATFERGRPATAEIAHLLETGDTIEAIGRRHTYAPLPTSMNSKASTRKRRGNGQWGAAKWRMEGLPLSERMVIWKSGCWKLMGLILARGYRPK